MNKRISALILCSILLCCSDIQLGPPIVSFSSFELCDIGNTANASDIDVNLNRQTGSTALLEYRLFLIKEEDQIPETIDDYKSIESGRYYAFQPSDVIPTRGTSPPSSMTDVFGNEIVENQRYTSALMSLSNDEELETSSVQLYPDWFVLTQNDIVTDFSRQFNFDSGIGAGSLTIFDDNIFMSSYDITEEITSVGRQDFSIQRMDRSGKSSEIFSGLALLGGNAVNSSGELFQSLIYENNIVKVTLDNKISTIETNGAELLNPDGIFINQDDEMFIVNRAKSEIVKRDKTGIMSVFAQLPYTNPKGITGDESGNLFVSHNTSQGQISKIDPNGEVSLLSRIPTFIPEDYLIDYFMYSGYLQYNQGFIYVAGMSTNFIYKVSMDGTIEEFAGSGIRGLPRGDKRKANLNRPNGIVFSLDNKTMFISGAEDTDPTHTQSSRPSRVWKIDLLE